jgi:hypothetical protein
MDQLRDETQSANDVAAAIESGSTEQLHAAMRRMMTRQLNAPTTSATTMPAEMRKLFDDVLGAKENPPGRRVDRP